MSDNETQPNRSSVPVSKWHSGNKIEYAKEWINLLRGVGKGDFVEFVAKSAQQQNRKKSC